MRGVPWVLCRLPARASVVRILVHLDRLARWVRAPLTERRYQEVLGVAVF
jgi:hypothetical protein